MNRQEIYKKLTEVFQDVFECNSIEINDMTTARDVKGWDSLMHITLISEIEDEFDMKFSMKDIIGMKNVGEMVDILEKET